MTSSVFGSWLTHLLSPVIIEGHTVEFNPALFFWVPWAAIIIIFLFWSGLKLNRGQVSNVRYFSLLVIGLWILVGMIYE